MTKLEDIYDGVRADEKPIAEWDTAALVEGRVKYLIEEGEDKRTEEEIRSSVYEDTLFFEQEYENLQSTLKNWMDKQKADGWYAMVRNFGWDNRNGHQRFITEDPAKFLSEILPQCECKYFIYDRGDHLVIRNFHHDSQTGNEFYFVFPEYNCAWCDKHLVTEALVLDNDTMDYICPRCVKKFEQEG